MRTDERGDTLLEVIIAVAIMGIVLVAFGAGLVAIVKMSDLHRKQASAGAYVRDYAEVIENWVAAGHFPGCASTSGYSALAIPSFPAGYNKSVDVDPGCTWGTDIAKLTLRVWTSDNRASEQLVMFVRKPCTATPC